MRRINHVLRNLERQKSWSQIHGYDSTQRDAVIAEWQRKYDRLAGVPERSER